MKAWTAPFSALACTLLLAAPPAASPLPAPSPSAPASNVVTRLKAIVPSGPSFVLHGTFPIPPRPFDRDVCPFSVIDPAGNTIPAQWELVARMEDWMVVELRARVQNPGWSGQKTFKVIENPSISHARDFDPAMLRMLLNPNSIRLRVRDQSGKDWTLPVAGVSSGTQFHRLGSVSLMARNGFETPMGGLQVWIGLDATEQEVELILNWHNGGLPAKPDVYFRWMQLLLPSGWTFTPVLPDPAIQAPYLVKADDHVLPQRMQRSFRLVVHRVGTSPNLREEGFAVGDWSLGGYFPQAIALPDLSHTSFSLTTQKNDDFNRLKNLLPTVPGETPVSFLWPAQGVYYGGMTSGTDIDQFEGVAIAWSGQVDGILSTFVEQLRYASRHMGCIYEADGDPIELDDFLNPNRTKPWVVFNSRFYGSPPQDAPFFFSRTGPGVGTASYDPMIFEPIDSQHLIRRTKANKVLVWLLNDPLAKLYVQMDAEIARMTMYEGPGGTIVVPSTPALGTEWGRGEAWLGDVMAAAFAVSDDAWRVRNAAWFVQYTRVLKTAQMPNDLFSAIDHGKIAEEAPYGSNGTANYFAHRSNEQVYLMQALLGAQEVAGIDCHDAIRRAGEGMWKYAWKPGQSGPLERYPAGPVGGPRFSSRSQFPPGLTSTVPIDSWHVATALGMALREGANMAPALQAYTQTNSLAAAKAKFLSWGTTNLSNRANALALLQKIVP